MYWIRDFNKTDSCVSKKYWKSSKKYAIVLFDMEKLDHVDLRWNENGLELYLFSSGAGNGKE